MFITNILWTKLMFYIKVKSAIYIAILQMEIVENRE